MFIRIVGSNVANVIVATVVAMSECLRGRGTMGIARVKGPIEGIQMPPRGTDNARSAAPDPKGQSWLDFPIAFRFNLNGPALATNIAS